MKLSIGLWPKGERKPFWIERVCGDGVEVSNSYQIRYFAVAHPANNMIINNKLINLFIKHLQSKFFANNKLLALFWYAHIQSQCELAIPKVVRAKEFGTAIISRFKAQVAFKAKYSVVSVPKLIPIYSHSICIL